MEKLLKILFVSLIVVFTVSGVAFGIFGYILLSNGDNLWIPPTPIGDEKNIIEMDRSIVALQNEVDMLNEYVALKESFEPVVGASVQTPTDGALFSTSLASGISTTDTAMTLVSAAYNAGASTLASSTYLFVLGQGGTNEELVLADCTATACTNMTRGIDRFTGTSSVTALKKTHNRGDSVKITTASLVIYSNIFRGKQNIETPLRYSSAISSSTFTTYDLINKDYADGLSFVGSPNGSETGKGIWEGATALESASSTILGSTGAGLITQARYATDTPTGPCATGYTAWGASCLVQALLDGKIHTRFIATSSAYTYNWGATMNYTGLNTYTATTSLATTTINGGIATAFFGGDGSDGALTISSGTTTINLGNAAVVTKNYTSISITGDGALAFSNPATNGSVIILKSQGNCTITSSTSTAIYLGELGAPGGAAGTGGGGADGAIGATPSQIIDTTTHGGGAGTTGGGVAGNQIVQAQTMYARTAAYVSYMGKLVVPGSGGGGGESGANDGGGTGANGGAGGRGAGALYLECGGFYNVTGTIYAKGGKGTDGGTTNADGGSGGGGAGGMFLAIYGLLTADSGTYTVTGGDGGAVGAGGAGTCGNGGGGGGTTEAAGTAATACSGGTGAAGGAGASGIAVRMKNNVF